MNSKCDINFPSRSRSSAPQRTTLQASTVVAIDNLQLAYFARLANAPHERGRGVDLLRKAGAAMASG